MGPIQSIDGSARLAQSDIKDRSFSSSAQTLVIATEVFFARALPFSIRTLIYLCRIRLHLFCGSQHHLCMLCSHLAPSSVCRPLALYRLLTPQLTILTCPGEPSVSLWTPTGWWCDNIFATSSLPVNCGGSREWRLSHIARYRWCVVRVFSSGPAGSHKRQRLEASATIGRLNV